MKCKYSYSKFQVLIKEKFDKKIHLSTLKRWYKRFSNEENWNFRDKSKILNKIYYKVTQDMEAQIISFRKKTGYGALKIKQCLNLDIHQDTVNEVLKRNNLTRTEHNRSFRTKYVRFERKHANSLWHIDNSEFSEEGKIIAVVDDTTRYCLGILHTKSVTTPVVTQFLDQLIQKFELPTQIISDNGSPYRLKSKFSKFDVWCRRRGIEHIRTRVKRPQTNGKVERLFGSISKEIKFCNNDLEQFRMRYNHFRPHQSLNNKTPAEEFYNFQRKLKW
ncbi:MAG: DDE-type integrase/transposase/recombinase [Candidatus Nanoarchaeia archaeon]